MKKIAVVPYAPGQAYEFYEDRLVIGDVIIYYSEILGYSYLLTHKNTSVSLIPATNSTSFVIYLDIGQNKPFQFGRSAGSAMYFKSDKQKTIDVIFAELVRCIDVIIGPMVLNRLTNLDGFESGELKVGTLSIYRDGLVKKTLFGQKQLNASDISWAGFRQGVVIIKDENGKNFFASPMSTMNAPLLPDVLNTLYGKQA